MISRIAAIIDWNSPSPRKGPPAVSATLRRPPVDDVLIEAVPGAVLGVGRVSSGGERAARAVTVDLAGGMSVVADSRLDNGAELRAAFSLAPHTPDAELFLCAFRRWGDDLGAHFIGDFAAAIWDSRRQQLIAVRDPFGVKPLLYCHLQGTLVLASDVEALVALAEPAREPDDHHVVEYLVREYESLDRTFWADLRRLPGGHVLGASARGIDVRRYARPPARDVEERSTADVHARIRDLLFQSVKRRLPANGRGVAHLSGGVDSSSIVCVADRIYRDENVVDPPLLVVSARYPGLACDEGPFIESVTSRIAIPFESWDGRARDFPDLVDPALAGPGMRRYRTGGTAGDIAIADRIGARVVLSGLGGDQVASVSGFGDSSHDRRHLVSALWRRKADVKELRHHLRLLLQGVLPVFVRQGVAVARMSLDEPRWLRHRWHGLAGHLVAKSIRYRKSLVLERIQQVHWEDLIAARFGRSVEIEQWCTAMCGVETRYPFLDWDLVQYVLAIPPRHWPTTNPNGRLHQAALAGLLPAAIAERKSKAAFSPALLYRIRSAEALLRKLFFSGPWLAGRWVRRAGAQACLERALFSGRDDFRQGMHVWRIATLEAWLRATFGYDAVPWEKI